MGYFGVLPDRKSVDFVADEMKAVFLTESHICFEDLAGVATTCT
jgi:hypothetical protein